MSAGKLTWGRRDWLGLMVLFLSSIAADVIGALLAVKGILPMAFKRLGQTVVTKLGGNKD